MIGVSVISPIPALAQFAKAQLEEIVLTTQTDKPLYSLGDLVRIFGSTSHLDGTPIEQATVAIEIKDPRGNTAYLNIVYSQEDGTYGDSFRLAESYPAGHYSIYVTAHKAGYGNALVENSFWASVGEGLVMLRITGHSITLNTTNVVLSNLNVTLYSDTILSIEVTCRLVLLSPNGTLVYDNFQGIGGEIDEKRVTVYNGSTLAAVDFQFPLQSPHPGYYTSSFLIYDVSSRNLQDSTAWSPAFLYTPPPKHSEDLGFLYPDSSLTSQVSVSLQRFEAVQYSFRVAENVANIIVDVSASRNAKFILVLTTDNSEIQDELLAPIQWEIQNVPSGQYLLKLIALSSNPSLIEVFISAGPLLTPSVNILRVYATSFSTAPGGKISYYVTVEWGVTQTDTLNVTCSMEGAIADFDEDDVFPLHPARRDVLLTIDLPQTTGTYTLVFQARLLLAGASSDFVSQVEVQENQYNITLAPTIEYYKESSSLWSIFFARERTRVDDPLKLSALCVSNINVVNVGVKDGNPVNATVEFETTNKAGSRLSFGDGPHYDVWIADNQYEYQIGLILAGDTETWRVTIPVSYTNRLAFTIKYRLSWLAEVWMLGISLIEAYLTASNFGLVGSTYSCLSDMVKLTGLFIYKTFTEREHGFMVQEDIASFLMGFPPTWIDYANAVFYRGRNPLMAIISALVTWHSSRSITMGQLLNTVGRLFVWLAVKCPWLKLGEIIEWAIIRAKGFYQLPLSAAWDGRPDEVLGNLGTAFSFVNMLKIIWDLLTKPQEEGKMVTSKLDLGAGQTFDPLVSIGFHGPVNMTSIEYFGDINEVSVWTEKGPEMDVSTMTFTVDQNLTSLYLPIVSDPAYQRNVLRSCGFNASTTRLDWPNGSDTFLIRGNGSMSEGLTAFSFCMNETWIEGFQEMRADAVENGTNAVLNCTLGYLFGKNLTYSIKVTLPQGSADISIASNGEYTVENNEITWNVPVDWFTVTFTPPSEEVEVIGITTSKSGCQPIPVVGERYPLTIYAVVRSQGTIPMNINVTFLANATLVGMNQTQLAPGENKTLMLEWDTSSFSYGNYTISVALNGTLHSYIYDWIFVTIPGDVNGNRIVNIFDIVRMAGVYGVKLSDPRYNPNCDIDGDGDIDIFDIVIAAGHYGKSW